MNSEEGHQVSSTERPSLGARGRGCEVGRLAGRGPCYSGWRRRSGPAPPWWSGCTSNCRRLVELPVAAPGGSPSLAALRAGVLFAAGERKETEPAHGRFPLLRCKELVLS